MINKISAKIEFLAQKEMVELLLRKGFDGEFICQSEALPIFMTGTIERCLEKMLTECHKTNTSYARCRLTTEFPNDYHSPPWICRIMLEFKPETGFRISGVALKKMGVHEPEKVVPLTNEQLPSFKDLHKMTIPQKKWKARLCSLFSPIKIKR